MRCVRPSKLSQADLVQNRLSTLSLVYTTKKTNKKIQSKIITAIEAEEGLQNVTASQ